KDNAMDSRLLSFRFQCQLPESAPLVLLPRCNALMPVVEAHATRWTVMPEMKQFPFGAYDRFTDMFYFLNLPKHGMERLPAPQALKARVESVLERSAGLIQEEFWAVLHADSLDSYSLDLFIWLSERVPVRFLVLADRPFSSRWNSSLESHKAVIWNPRTTEGKLEVKSGVLSRFDTAVFHEQAKYQASGSLALALQWMEHDEKWRAGFSPESLGLDPAERGALLSGSPHKMLGIKGLADSSGAPFPSGSVGLEPLSEEIIRELNQGGNGAVSRILARLGNNPGLFLMAQAVSDNGADMQGEVCALVCFATGQFKAAISYMESLKEQPAFAILYANALFETGDLDHMVSFCRKQGIEPSCYHFLMAQRGEEFSLEKLEPEHLFQILLMQGKLDELKARLSEYEQKFGKNSLFYEYQGELVFRSDPSEGELLFRQGIELAQENRQLYRKAFILKRLGNALFRIPGFRDAEVCYYQAMELFVSLGNAWQFEKVAYNMAMVDMNLCRLDAAADVFQKDLKKNRASGHSRYVVFNLKALGKVAAIAYRFEEATALLEEALQLAENGGFEDEITGIHYILVTVYLELGNLEMARKSLDSLTRMAKKQPFWDTQIHFLNVEYSRKSGDIEAAGIELSKIDPGGLSPDDVRYVRVLDALITSRSLAEVADLYADVGNAGSEQFLFSLRAWLLDAYPRLVGVVDEEELKRDYQRVRAFNGILAGRFRRHFMARKRSFLDPEIFARLSRVMDHARKNEPASFQQAFRRLGEWAGFTDFELRRPNLPAKEHVYSIGDTEGRLFLDVKPEPEEELMPFLKFVVGFAVSNLPRLSPVAQEDIDSECPYLSLIVGHSEPVRKLKGEISRAADFMFPVLVTGESGTGKELAARAVHFCSSRKDKPFLAINCAALPDNLMESELFGYARGAFTGAQVSRAGLLESARDGTLFMDEIGEMPMATQAKLLRVLQEREFYRLGDSTSRKVSARFVFATNRNLEQAVKEKQFREDLYYRIAGFRLFTPSLNERRGDIPELADYLLSQMDDGAGKKLSAEARDILSGYTYRGNIRELQNILMMGLVNGGSAAEIRPEHLPVLTKTGPIAFTGKLKQATRAFQKQYLRQVLEENEYNNSRTGRILGITRQRIIQLRKEYEL
ncbi:MAG: AAA domain-containing protein, partial [Acidobacteria bacterium]|nr:AAA domain-containing protein [Acidobacteriota bacterium]